MSILDGLTREQALDKIMGSSAGDYKYFVNNKMIYSCPIHAGVGKDECGEEHCGKCWEGRINAHYDEADKPKWVEPSMIMCNKCMPFIDEEFYAGCIVDAEIAETNARRKINAFINANGGGGRFTIYWSSLSRFLPYECAELGASLMNVGIITCATLKLAEEVIHRFPDELKLLSGVK